MKILLAVPIHAKKEYIEQSKREISDYGEIKNELLVEQAHYFWLQALKELGHEVNIFIYNVSRLYTLSLDYRIEKFKKKHFVKLWEIQNGIRSRLPKLSLDISLKNKSLLKEIEVFEPDVFIMSGGSNIVTFETLSKIKYNYGVKTILTHGMSPVLTATDTEKKFAPYYDLIAVNDFYHAVSWRELGGNAFALPVTACNPDFHKEYKLTRTEEQNYNCDVCFVGALMDNIYYRERLEVLEALASDTFDLAIWSPNEDVIVQNDNLRRFYRGKASGEKMYKIYNASKILLNIHGPTMQHGGNLRTFEVTGCGAFQLIDHYNSDWFEDGKEIVSFADITDLKDKIKYYLQNEDERRRIACQGQQRAYRDHTYKHRMSKILDLVMY